MDGPLFVEFLRVGVTQTSNPCLSLCCLFVEGLIVCSICNLPFSVSELPAHYKAELEKVDLLSKDPSVYDSKRSAAVVARRQLASGSKRTSKPQLDENEMVRYGILYKVKTGRIKRSHRSSSRNSRQSSPSFDSESQACFICQMILPKDSLEINRHIDQCLANQEYFSNPQPESSSSRLEEYTWAGQTRIRATALFEGNYSDSGFAVHRRTDKDVEEEIDIDNDDTNEFGESQYSELDLQKYQNNDSDNSETQMNFEDRDRMDSSTREDDDEIDIEDVRPEDVDTSLLRNAEPSAILIIESLKDRIKFMEKQAKKVPTCLICLEPYKDPLVSVKCWHVHCESCWLQTLATKKLCPQDNLITTSADLRKIYLEGTAVRVSSCNLHHPRKRFFLRLMDFLNLKYSNTDSERVFWLQGNARVGKLEPEEKMLIPKDNRKKIYQYLFQEGVLVAKKDYDAPKHQDVDVPNLHVIKALQSLNSRGYVKTSFSWQYYYYYLTNEGIEYLREYLHLPAEIVPRTFIKTTKPASSRPPRDGDRPERFRAPREGGDYRRKDDWGAEKKEGASGDYKPEFRGGMGRGRRE
ncbi:hypothetical protein HK098_002674 [Nowakowskiella sp. JEL0407]|nr:hypothetical protein HK098_002674 [Nowakowskiella sp. JEL0407]